MTKIILPNKETSKRLFILGRILYKGYHIHGFHLSNTPDKTKGYLTGAHVTL